MRDAAAAAGALSEDAVGMPAVGGDGAVIVDRDRATGAPLPPEPPSVTVRSLSAPLADAVTPPLPPPPPMLCAVMPLAVTPLVVIEPLASLVTVTLQLPSTQALPPPAPLAPTLSEALTSPSVPEAGSTADATAAAQILREDAVQTGAEGGDVAAVLDRHRVAAAAGTALAADRRVERDAVRVAVIVVVRQVDRVVAARQDGLELRELVDVLEGTVADLEHAVGERGHVLAQPEPVAQRAREFC